jgi:hypothetical protein
MGWGALQIILIALVTLPLAGLPLAIWICIEYRRDCARQDLRPHLRSVP